MIEYLASLPLVEAEVEGKGRCESDNATEDHEVRHVAVSMSIERVISHLIPVWFVVRVGLIHDQVGVRVRGEDVLMVQHWKTVEVRKLVVQINFHRLHGPQPVERNKLGVALLDEGLVFLGGVHVVVVAVLLAVIVVHHVGEAVGS